MTSTTPNEARRAESVVLSAADLIFLQDAVARLAQSNNPYDQYAARDAKAVLSRIMGEAQGANHMTDHSPPEPVHQDEKGWWFWDETWADRSGPYRTRRATPGGRST